MSVGRSWVSRLAYVAAKRIPSLFRSSVIFLPAYFPVRATTINYHQPQM